jgi:hypothetical protein
MRGVRVTAAVAAAILALTITAAPSKAAMEIAVTVSPREGVVGAPIEILVRTFTPFNAGALDLPSPSVTYAAPSGLWNVLYPFPDYAFSARAVAPTGKTLDIDLVLDGGDASLWRGDFTPDAPGQWTIRLPNSPSMPPIAVNVRTSTDNNSFIFATVALAAGLLIGGGIGRWVNRRSDPLRATAR